MSEQRQHSGKRVLVGKEGDHPRVVLLEDVFLKMDQFALDHQDREHGGIMLGFASFIEARNRYEVVIEQFIPMPQPAGLARFAISRKDWEQAQERIEKQYPGYEIVGWMHTHPGFGTFLSTLDKEQHYRFFPEAWEIAYVVDPQNMARGFHYCVNKNWRRVSGYYIEQTGQKLPTTTKRRRANPAGRKSRRPAWASVLVAFFWVFLLGASVAGFFWMSGYDIFRSDQRVYDVDEPSPPVRVQATMTPIEAELWERDLESEQETSQRQLEPPPPEPRPDSSQPTVPAQVEQQPTPAPVEEELPTYTVRSGDSLWRIARVQLGNAALFQDIAELNGIPENTVLQPGMVLKLPLN